jgi:anaerobic sulfite reductase subunit B
MDSMTPLAAELLHYREDSADTRYFKIRLIAPNKMSAPQPGQFCMLSVPGHGEAAFTFATAPDKQGVFHILVRAIGELTYALFALKPGQRIGIRGPFGKAWPLAEIVDQQLLIIAGGCGLAPLNGLIDHLLKTHRKPQLTLVYGARTSAHQVLNSQRQRWNKQIPIFDVLEDGPDGGTPLSIMPNVIKSMVDKPEKILLCGPEAMMQISALYFLAQGFPATSIWAAIECRMHCAIGLCGHCYLEQQYACTDGPIYRWDQLQPLLRRSI